MNELLFGRSNGTLSPEAFATALSTDLVHDIQHTPQCVFDGGEKDAEFSGDEDRNVVEGDIKKLWAHQSGVNALCIDRFDGRLLLSGGADSSIKIWDLDHPKRTEKLQTNHRTGVVARTASAHKFGITHLSFYSFDTAAFLSSSYDHTIKVYATDQLAVSASFDLGYIVYTHSMSNIASHLLIACATQHPAVRLVDLRSGSSAHSLAGHQGAVLSVAWHPTKEHILASGGIDGTARVWDVRKSAASLGLLDMEDSVGFGDRDGLGTGGAPRLSSKAHNGAVNGMTWTDDGIFLVSAGHDQSVRVWDAETGSNTLASFGPTLRNSQLSTLPLLLSPTALAPSRKSVLYYPNEHELLMFELHEGRLLRRMRIPGPLHAAIRSSTGERNVRNRITSLAWRGAADGVYSGHSDGQIRVWRPAKETDEEEDVMTKDMEESEERESSKRKRDVLDDVFRDLTKQKITFG